MTSIPCQCGCGKLYLTHNLGIGTDENYGRVKNTCFLLLGLTGQLVPIFQTCLEQVLIRLVGNRGGRQHVANYLPCPAWLTAEFALHAGLLRRFLRTAGPSLAPSIVGILGDLSQWGARNTIGLIMILKADIFAMRGILPTQRRPSKVEDPQSRETLRQQNSEPIGVLVNQDGDPLTGTALKGRAERWKRRIEISNHANAACNTRLVNPTNLISGIYHPHPNSSLADGISNEQANSSLVIRHLLCRKVNHSFLLLHMPQCNPRAAQPGLANNLGFSQVSEAHLHIGYHKNQHFVNR